MLARKADEKASQNNHSVQSIKYINTNKMQQHYENIYIPSGHNVFLIGQITRRNKKTFCGSIFIFCIQSRLVEELEHNGLGCNRTKGTVEKAGDSNSKIEEYNGGRLRHIRDVGKKEG